MIILFIFLIPNIVLGTAPTASPSVSPSVSPTSSPVESTTSFNIAFGPAEMSTTKIAGSGNIHTLIRDSVLPSLTTDNTERVLYVTETVQCVFPSTFTDDKVETIKTARNCGSCIGTITTDGVLTFTSTLTDDYDTYDVTNTFDSTEFVTALGDNTISCTDGTDTVKISLTLVFTKDTDDTVPLYSTGTIDVLNTRLEELKTTVNALAFDSVTEHDLVLCNGRETCTDNRGACVEDTGICTCTAGTHWGVDCETTCSCGDNGICLSQYCVCEYPYYGEFCENIKSCSSGQVPEGR